MKQIGKLMLVVCFLSTLSAAQERPAPAAMPNTVFVGADGKFEAAPDTAVVSFNIAAQEETAKAAYDRAARAAQQVRDLLRNNGIDPKQAEIGYFALQPVYDYRSAKRKLLAYRVNSSVSARLKDFTKVAGIVEQLASLDVTENQSLRYELQDTESAKVKAVEDAFQRARSEAAAVAKAGGRTLGEVLYASVDTYERGPVVPMQMRIQTAAGAAPVAPAPTEQFTPNTVTVGAHVNAMFALK